LPDAVRERLPDLNGKHVLHVPCGTGEVSAELIALGALVTGVVAGSPAATAGIGRYAVITSAAGVTIDSSATLGTALHAHKPGDQVAITWVDANGSSHTASVTLATGPAV